MNQTENIQRHCGNSASCLLRSAFSEDVVAVMIMWQGQAIAISCRVMDRVKPLPIPFSCCPVQQMAKTKAKDVTHEDCITIGSDCAGLCSEGIALELLGVKHKHLFACESNSAVRHLLYEAFGKNAMVYYRDVTTRCHELTPKVDLYCFGAPCQPFSPAGRGKGMTDPRSKAFSSCVAYIAAQRPKAFVCENSHRLLSKKFAKEWHTVKKELRLLGYCLKYKIINTKNHGIPQSRPRTYVVGVKRDIMKEKFRFPRSIPAEPVDRFLDDGLTSSCALRVKLPQSAHVAAIMNRAHSIFQMKGVDSTQEPCFVETGASLKWSSVMVGQSPCLTSTRCATGGHFITHRGRLMTMSEMCRLQGLPPNRINYKKAKVSHRRFAKAVGNMMSINVLQRILPGVLKSAGLSVKGHFDEIPSLFSHRLRSRTWDEDTDSEAEAWKVA
jgi:DNA-cytosine methyltransferase